MDQRRTTLSFIAILFLFAFVSGCDRDDGDFRPLELDDDPVVFIDSPPPGFEFQPFLNTNYSALQLASVETFNGSEGGLRIDIVPSTPTVQYSGGAFIAGLARDFSGYNALRFYAKTNRESATLNEVGIGNDNSGTSRYPAYITNVPLTSDWTEVIIPIPDPAKLVAERGLLYFAEGYEESETSAYHIWIDEIEFVFLRGITNPRPAINAQTIDAFVGARVSPSGGSVNFDVNGSDLRVFASAGYFDYFLESGDAVKVEGDALEVVGSGTAVVRANLDGVEATGILQVNAQGAPTNKAPTPSYPAGNVYSLFSDHYPNRAVDTFSAPFDAAELFEFNIQGDAVKGYTGLSLNDFLAIEIVAEQVDGTQYDGFRFDVWVPAEGLLGVKLIDFGPNGGYDEPGTGDDSEAEIGLGLSGELVAEQWNTIEIPLADFESSPPAVPGNLLTSRANLAQIIMRGDMGSLFLDNLLFYRD